MEILSKHFDGKDTTVIKIDGKVVVSNGCQVFNINRLDAVCEEFNVSNEQKQELLDASKDLQECTFDELREAISRDKRLVEFIANEDILEKLSKDDKWGVRHIVACNQNTPISALDRLSKDNRCIVRHTVARNQNTATSVLEDLSKDSGACVRYAVAENQNTPISVLEELTKDGDWVVRYMVACNQNTPASVLEELSKDNNVWVRYAVAQERLKR